MKAEDLVGSIEKFFLDLVGTFIPGVLFIGALVVLYQPDQTLASLWALRPLDQFGWIACLAIGFVVGHAVTSIGENLLIPVADATFARLAKSLGSRTPRILRRFKPEADLFAELRSGPLFAAVIKHYDARLGTTLAVTESGSFLLARNLAMGVLGEDRYTVYRFMFLMLLNQGAATVCVIFGLLAIALDFISYKSTLTPDFSVRLWLTGLLALLVAVPFLERRYRFFGIAMSVPFSMAASRIAEAKDPESAGRTPSTFE